MQTINWIRHFIYGQNVTAERLILDAGDAPVFKAWLASLSGEYGASKVTPVAVATLEEAVRSVQPLVFVSDGRARHANAGYSGVFYPDPLPTVAEVKTATTRTCHGR